MNERLNDCTDLVCHKSERRGQRELVQEWKQARRISQVSSLTQE